MTESGHSHVWEESDVGKTVRQTICVGNDRRPIGNSTDQPCGSIRRTRTTKRGVRPQRRPSLRLHGLHAAVPGIPGNAQHGPHGARRSPSGQRVCQHVAVLAQPSVDLDGPVHAPSSRRGQPAAGPEGNGLLSPIPADRPVTRRPSSANGTWDTTTTHPRPGFDHWVSFRGQGAYFDPTLNINGNRKEFEGYTTDILTDQAIQWLEQTRSGQTVFSVPVVQSGSLSVSTGPAPPGPIRRRSRSITPRRWPIRSGTTRRNRTGSASGGTASTASTTWRPAPFDKDPVPDFDDLYHSYCETVHGLDENLGRVLEYLDEDRPDATTRW